MFVYPSWNFPLICWNLRIEFIIIIYHHYSGTLFHHFFYTARYMYEDYIFVFVFLHILLSTIHMYTWRQRNVRTCTLHICIYVYVLCTVLKSNPYNLMNIHEKLNFKEIDWKIIPLNLSVSTEWWEGLRDHKSYTYVHTRHFVFFV